MLTAVSDTTRPRARDGGIPRIGERLSLSGAHRPDPRSAHRHEAGRLISRAARRRGDPAAVPRLAGPVHGPATWRIFRAAAGSVERRLAVPAPLELEEAVRLGHQRDPVPQTAGRLAARRGRDDGTEDGVAADAHDRGADVQADVVERLVVRVLDELIELGAVRRANQRRGQAYLGQGLRDRLRILPASLDVVPGPDGGVDGPEDVRAAIGGRGRDHPDRPPGLAHPFQVLVGEALAFVLDQVEVGQRHDPPLGAHRPDLLHLQHPAGSDPGPGAQRIEPELHVFLGLSCHARGNSATRPGIPLSSRVSGGKAVRRAAPTVPSAATVNTSVTQGREAAPAPPRTRPPASDPAAMPTLYTVVYSAVATSALAGPDASTSAVCSSVGAPPNATPHSAAAASSAAGARAASPRTSMATAIRPSAASRTGRRYRSATTPVIHIPATVAPPKTSRTTLVRPGAKGAT